MKTMMAVIEIHGSLPFPTETIPNNGNNGNSDSWKPIELFKNGALQRFLLFYASSHALL